MLTPSLVMVGAPHFFSNTTLRPLGPSVTFTASASWFIPRSRPRRASSSNAIIFDGTAPPSWSGADEPGDARDGRPEELVSSLGTPASWHSPDASARHP